MHPKQPVKEFTCFIFCALAITMLSIPTFAQKMITVKVSKNVEVLSALNNQLSTEFLKDSLEDPYLYKTTRVMRLNYQYFVSYKQHRAVVATQAMLEKIGTGVYLLGLFYEELPSMRQRVPISTPILKAVHENLDSATHIINNYMLEVKRFYEDTHFETYFNDHRPLYQLAIEQVRKNLPSSAFIPTLESYYGATNDDYCFLAMPSFKSGWGMSWEIFSNDRREAYNIAAPLQEQVVTKDGRVLDAGFDNASEIRNLSVHEFGHCFVNPITQLPMFEAKINEYQQLFQPIEGQGQYHDWFTLFNEHVVRAGEIRIAVAMGDAKESEKLRSLYANWVYLDHFLAQLQYFEENRRTFKTFEQFLPMLIDSLKNLKR